MQKPSQVTSAISWRRCKISSKFFDIDKAKITTVLTNYKPFCGLPLLVCQLKIYFFKLS